MYRQLMSLAAGSRTTLLRKLFVLLAALVVSAQAMAVIVTLHPLSGTHLGTIALGQSINVQIVATGGGTPYNFWQCDAGAPDYDGSAICLPAGLSIDRDTGVLSGTPTTPGTYTFTVSAVENFGDSGAATYTLVVTSALPPTAGAVNATVPANSSSNAITLNLGGGAATSVTVSSPASHGTATASGTSITYTPTAGYSGSDSFRYTATNGNGTSNPATVSVTVMPPTLSFRPTSLSNGMVGSAYSTTVSASNGMAPYSYAIIAGALPAGLSLNSSTGVISGTPSASGTANLTLAATDANSVMGARAYTLTIAVQPPTASAVSATVAANSSSNPITLNLGGGTTTSVAVSSPASHGTATASGTSITYTPTAGYSGSDNFSYTATNASGTSNPATVTVTVSPPTLSFTPASLSNGMVGSPYSASVSASGGTAPYTYVVSAGALPNGLILYPNGSISGTPSASGTANLTITATDTNSATGSRAYTLTIAVQPPTASAVSATVAANSSSNLITLNLGGGAATSVTVSSPASHGTATASGTSITYTPTAGYSGSDSFAYTATNASGTSNPATVTVTVSPPTLSFTPASLSNGMVGSPYSASVSASGGTAPYTYVVSAGALPNGLILYPNGSISGTPSASGTANLTITATDTNSATGSRAYTLTIAVQPPTASAVSATVAANSSSNPITLNLGGGAPSSVTVSSPASHGTATASGTSITYTPTAGYSGTDSFTYTATNGSGTSSPATVTVTVSPATLSMTPASLSNGMVGSAYSATLGSSGGTAPYSYVVSAGALPAGLSLNTNGAISGIPTASGTANLTITSTDAYGATGSRAFTLSIAVQAPTTSAVSATVTANSSSNPITLNLGGGAPSSVTVSSPASHGTATASGTSITYTPTAGYSGTDSFTYTATNGSGTSSPATVTVTVSPATLSMTPASLSNGMVGSSYSATLGSSGGTAPYRYAISAGTLPAGLSLNTSTGVISGTPSATGTANLSITTTDVYGATGSRAYALTIDVQAPTAGAVSTTVIANSSSNPIPLNLGGGATSSVSIASQASHGTATASGTSISYTPTAGYSGTDSFTYTATNGSGTSSPATVSITVNPARPVAGEVTLTVAANSLDNLVPVNVSGGAATSVAVATAPTYGTVKVNGTTIRYTPLAGYSGSDSFTYTASNVTGTSAPAKVTITTTRADPTKTADVANMVATHTDVAKRFTRAQVTNFQSRLEWLHRRLDGGSVRSGSLEQTTPAARTGTGARPAAPNMAGNGFAPFADAGSTAPSAPGQTPLPFRSGPVPTGQEPTFNIGGRANNLGNSGLDVWSAGVISLGRYKEADIHFSTSGISFGADQRISNKLVLGAGIGFGHERQKVGDDGSRNTADDYSFSVYGTYQPLPALYLDGVIGTGRMDIDMRRHISDASGDAQAKRSGTQWFASLSGSYEFQNEHYTLSPYGRLDYAITRLDAVTETGASSDTLVYLSQRATMSKVALGLRGASTYVLDSFTMRPYFRLEYQRDLESPGAARIAYADDITGTVYQIQPTGVARNSLVLGIGSDILYRAWTFSGRYQFTNNSGAMKMHTLGVEVRRSF